MVIPCTNGHRLSKIEKNQLIKFSLLGFPRLPRLTKLFHLREVGYKTVDTNVAKGSLEEQALQALLAG